MRVCVSKYASDHDNPEFFNELFKQIAKTNNAEIVISRDFNLVMDPSMDHHNGAWYKPKSFEMLNQLMDQLDMVDLWRIQNPETHLFSWRCLKMESYLQVELI